MPFSSGFRPILLPRAREVAFPRVAYDALTMIEQLCAVNAWHTVTCTGRESIQNENKPMDVKIGAKRRYANEETRQTQKRSCLSGFFVSLGFGAVF